MGSQGPETRRVGPDRRSAAHGPDRVTPVLPALIVALLAACGPDPKVGEPLPRPPPGAARPFSELAATVIVPRCATSGCHSGMFPPAWPSLDAGVAWAELVGVPSQQAPALKLVEPFAPGSSYLVLKLRGTAGAAGGIPTPMPIGDAALDEADVAAIEAWIANGAPND